MSLEESAISVRRLTYAYGERKVLDRVDLNVPTGAFYGFLGQNGAGKSTLIRTLCGFTPPTKGEIRVAGVDVVRDPLGVRPHIGVVSEDVALYDRLTGSEFLAFAGQMHGLSAAEAHRRADDLMERLDLTGAADRMISAYSLGMQKKTAFAAALIHAPRVLFLDEPFNGVDAASTRTLCALLKHLTRERGVTIFFTSHVLEMAERLCDRAAILHAGRIVREGSMAAWRSEAEAQGMTLEDLFLQSTGARTATESALAWYA